jgi:hypothetical protein
MTMAAHVSLAQGGPAPQAPGPPPIMSVNDPHNPIHYTAAQQKTMNAIRIKFQTQEMKIANDPSLTTDQKKSKITQLAKDLFATFNSTLTPTQKAATKVQIAKRNAKMAAVLAVRKKNSAVYLKLKNQLMSSLTAGQKKKLKDIQTAAVGQANSIKASSASDDVKQSQLQGLQKSMESQLKSVFTPTQQSTISQMQALQMAEPAEEQKAEATH